MNTIITLSIIVIVLLCVLFTKKNVNKTVENSNPKTMESIKGCEYRVAKYDDIDKKRRKRREMREKRMVRKRKIWAVLRYMVTYNHLMESSDFYSFNNNLIDHNHAKGEIRKLNPDKSSFYTAIRFCRMENYYGTCDYQLNDEDVKYIINWRSNSIDVNDALKTVLNSYKNYWDGVLSSYVRQSARKKRLQYLIEDLENIMNLPYIQEHPDVLQGMKELQIQYQMQLNESTK